jgi:hypothetical protein
MLCGRHHENVLSFCVVTWTSYHPLVHSLHNITQLIIHLPMSCPRYSGWEQVGARTEEHEKESGQASVFGGTIHNMKQLRFFGALSFHITGEAKATHCSA